MLGNLIPADLKSLFFFLPVLFQFDPILLRCLADNRFERLDNFLICHLFAPYNDIAIFNALDCLYNHAVPCLQLHVQRIEIIYFAGLFKSYTDYIYHAFTSNISNSSPMMMSLLRTCG